MFGWAKKLWRAVTRRKHAEAWQRRLAEELERDLKKRKKKP